MTGDTIHSEKAMMTAETLCEGWLYGPRSNHTASLHGGCIFRPKVTWGLATVFSPKALSYLSLPCPSWVTSSPSLSVRRELGPGLPHQAYCH